MKVKGSKAPSGAYSMEPQPNKPGYVMMRFYENAAQAVTKAITLLAQ